MSVAFAGLSSCTPRETAEAVVEEWLSAGGANRPEDQRAYLARRSDAAVVADLRRHWHVEGVDDADLRDAVRSRRRELEDARRTILTDPSPALR
jgi:hypothetical protein